MTTTFRPPFEMFRKRLPLLILVAAIAVVTELLRSLDDLGPTAVLVAVVIAAVALYFVLYYRNVSVEAGAGMLRIRNAFGISHVVDPANVATVLLAEQLSSGSHYLGTEQIARLFVLDEDGRAVLRWNGRRWSMDQMIELVRVLGVPVTVVPEQIAPLVLHKRFPRALPWWEAHPFVLMAVIFVVVAVVLVLVLTNAVVLP